MAMRILPVLLLALTTTPAVAGKEDIPLVIIGLPFSPETPTPVAPTHPLYHRIEVGEIGDLPSAVRTSALNIFAAAKGSSVNEALRETLRRMNLLATESTGARTRLTVTWRGTDTPLRFMVSRNAARATLHYRLVRIDNGQQLFDREIVTSANGGGVDASMRDKGILRAAIAANFASAANCLDRAAFGTAPRDCALVPKFSVAAVRQR